MTSGNRTTTPTAAPPAPIAVSVDEAARLAGISRDGIERAIASGALRAAWLTNPAKEN